MMIRTRTGVTVDGFVSTADGWPVLASMPALGAPTWPWPDLDVYVLTSTALPADTPAHVIASQGGPEGLLEQLRTRGSDGDVHLVGGPKTIRAFCELGALDRLELVVLPFLAGQGLPLSPEGSPPMTLGLARSGVSYPDGAVELVYIPE